MTTLKTCSIAGCDRKHFGRGWCNAHYLRWRNHGDPLAGGRRYATPEEAFAARTERRGDCLIWTGATNGRYGQMRASGMEVYVHRWAYERDFGAIPEGVVVDHLCRQKLCCNSAHLRLATPSENNCNAGPRARNASGHKGVSQHGAGWVAEIQRDRRRLRKAFRTKAEAAAQYKEWSRELHGEFGATE